MTNETSVDNVNNHKAFKCNCGSVKFHLLKTGNIECAECGYRDNISWCSGLARSGKKYIEGLSYTHPDNFEDCFFMSTSKGACVGTFYSDEDGKSEPFFSDWNNPLSDAEDADCEAIYDAIWYISIKNGEPTIDEDISDAG